MKNDAITNLKNAAEAFVAAIIAVITSIFSSHTELETRVTNLETELAAMKLLVASLTATAEPTTTTEPVATPVVENIPVAPSAVETAMPAGIVDYNDEDIWVTWTNEDGEDRCLPWEMPEELAAMCMELLNRGIVPSAEWENANSLFLHLAMSRQTLAIVPFLQTMAAADRIAFCKEAGQTGCEQFRIPGCKQFYDNGNGEAILLGGNPANVSSAWAELGGDGIRTGDIAGVPNPECLAYMIAAKKDYRINWGDFVVLGSQPKMPEPEKTVKPEVKPEKKVIDPLLGIDMDWNGDAPAHDDNDCPPATEEFVPLSLPGMDKPAAPATPAAEEFAPLSLPGMNVVPAEPVVVPEAKPEAAAQARGEDNDHDVEGAPQQFKFDATPAATAGKTFVIDPKLKDAPLPGKKYGQATHFWALSASVGYLPFAADGSTGYYAKSVMHYMCLRELQFQGKLSELEYYKNAHGDKKNPDFNPYWYKHVQALYDRVFGDEAFSANRGERKSCFEEEAWRALYTCNRVENDKFRQKLLSTGTAPLAMSHSTAAGKTAYRATRTTLMLERIRATLRAAMGMQ